MATGTMGITVMQHRFITGAERSLAFDPFTWPSCIAQRLQGCALSGNWQQRWSTQTGAVGWLPVPESNH